MSVGKLNTQSHCICCQTIVSLLSERSPRLLRSMQSSGERKLFTMVRETFKGFPKAGSQRTFSQTYAENRQDMSKFFSPLSSAFSQFFTIILEYISIDILSRIFGYWRVLQNKGVFDGVTAWPRLKTSCNNKPSISGCLYTRNCNIILLTENLQYHHRIRTHIRRRTRAISYTPVTMSSRRTTGVIS